MKDTSLTVHPNLATLQLILANWKMIKINEQLPRGLIVSCQAYAGDPLYGSSFMAAMAKAAEIGGAVGIRANSPKDIRAIRAVTRLPIIGLYKVFSPDTEVYITPDFEAADQISRAGRTSRSSSLTYCWMPFCAGAMGYLFSTIPSSAAMSGGRSL